LALSFLYGPTLTSIQATGKTIALIIGISVDKVMSLLFIMLFRLVIIFLPGSKGLLILWLQSPSTVFCLVIGFSQRRELEVMKELSSRQLGNKKKVMGLFWWSSG